MENKGLRIIKDIGVIAFLLLFPHFIPLPFYSYAIVGFVVIWFILRKEGNTFRDIGLSKKGITLRAFVIGIVSALVWVGFMQLLYIPVIKSLFTVPDYTEYNFIRDDISKLIMTIIAAWLIGGFYEEVVFRGYIQNTLEKKLLKSSTALMSIIITSVLFGFYHWQQDVFGVIAAILGGFFWSTLYKKFNNNLWISIFSHAIFDTITLVLIYIGKFGNLY